MPRSTPRIPGTFLGFALLIGTLLLYAGTYRYPLLFDDRIINPPELRRDLFLWMTLQPRWLSYGSFGLNFLASEMDVFWYRVVNVLLHASVACVLYAFLRRLLAALTLDRTTPRPSLDVRLPAFCAAAVFAVHPVAVYGVAYLAERSILLATLFSLFSLTAFLQGCVRNNTRLLWYSVLAYFLATASKEHVIMLPALAVAIALAVRRPSWTIARALAWPLLGFTLIALYTVARMRGFLGATYEPYAREVLPGTSPDWAANETSTTTEKLSPYVSSILTQCALFFRYLSAWLLPNPAWLSADIRVPFAKGYDVWPYGAAVFAFGAYGAGATALLLRRGLLGLVGFGLLCPWVLFFTEFAATRLQEPFVLYRSYLWMIGLSVLLAVAASRLQPRTLVVGTLALVVVLVPIARDRMDSFSTPLKFWDDAARKNTDHSLPFVDRSLSNRAVALMQSGRDAEALRDLDLAIRLNPLNAHSWINRATIYARMGRMQDAESSAEESLRLDPKFGEAYSERCSMRMRAGRDSEAFDDCNHAVKLLPDYPTALLNRGVLLAKRGRQEEAMLDFDAIMRHDQRNPLMLYNRGMLLREMGRIGESREALRAACKYGMHVACEQMKR